MGFHSHVKNYETIKFGVDLEIIIIILAKYFRLIPLPHMYILVFWELYACVYVCMIMGIDYGTRKGTTQRGKRMLRMQRDTAGHM